MGSYLRPDGTYYEGDLASPLDQPCAPRPAGYVFTGTPSADPSVCWRPKTAQELNAELDAEASEFRRIRLVVAAFAEVAFAFIKAPSMFATAAAFKQAIMQRYREKLGE